MKSGHFGYDENGVESVCGSAHVCVVCVCVCLYILCSYQYNQLKL